MDGPYLSSHGRRKGKQYAGEGKHTVEKGELIRLFGCTQNSVMCDVKRKFRSANYVRAKV